MDKIFFRDILSLDQMREIRLHYQKVKSSLRKGTLPEPFLGSKFSFSPYMACSHGCVYCDGRAEKYWVKGEFDRDIVVRTNAPANLEEELGKLRDRGIVSFGSGISDVYQPLEKSEKLTARCAEILVRSRRPVMVLTKSDLVLRDLPLWTQVNQESRFFLAVSLMTLDEEIVKIFEPGASPVQQRLDIIRQFKEDGCAVGVLAMPFLPGITDGQEDMDALFKTLKKLDVDFVISGALTLRPGRQKDFYLEKIENRELKNYYLSLYGEDRPSGAPRGEYLHSFEKRSAGLLKKYALNPQVSHRLYAPHYYSYDQVFLLLSHMESLYASRGVNTGPLKKALGEYVRWLKEERKKFTRKIGGFRELDFFFRELLTRDAFEGILKNEKLTAFIKKVVLEEMIYNYVTMELEPRERE